MKVIMRTDKTQVKSQYYWVKETGTFDRRAALAAGYKTYDVILVGASGGRSGTATGTSGGYQYANGGGGGGSLRLSGRLIDLPDVSTVVAGEHGVGGDASTKAEAPAGNGTDGEASSFNAYSAFGGKGAKGSDYDYTSSRDFETLGKAGDGGGNSAGLGVPGVGGTPYKTDPQGNVAGVPPTSGSYVAGGVAPVIAGGAGGGGGYGRTSNTNASTANPTPGEVGAYPGPLQAGGTAEATNWGGGGGGARVNSLYDIPDYDPATRFGTYSTSTMTDVSPDGAVVLVLS